MEGELGLRELLIEAQAELLQRDAAVEHLTSVSTPAGAKAVATRTRKRESPTDQRKVALDAAVERAAGRLANVRKEIRALEKEGAAGSQAELDALRKTEETTAKRLAGFQRRSGKLENRLQSNGNGDGHSEAPQKPRPPRCPGVQRRRLSAQRMRLSARRRRSAPRVRPAARGSAKPGAESSRRRSAGGYSGADAAATPERPKKKPKRPRDRGCDWAATDDEGRRNQALRIRAPGARLGHPRPA